MSRTTLAYPEVRDFYSFEESREKLLCLISFACLIKGVEGFLRVT